MLSIKKLVLGLAVAVVAVVTPISYVVAQNNDSPQGGSEVRTRSSDADVNDVSAAASPICRRLSAANGAGQDILLTTADPRTYTGTAWQNVDCAATTFRLKFGERALVVADLSAETDCNGSNPNNGQWCQVRALLNGAEGAPLAAEPSSFAFDSVAGGASNWQAHALNRGWEVRCAVDNGCQYKFVVQTRNHDASITGFWLDEVSAHLRVTPGAPAPL